MVQLQKAVYLGGAVAILLEKSGIVLDLDEKVRYETMLTALRAQLGYILFENLFAHGQLLTLNQVLEYCYG